MKFKKYFLIFIFVFLLVGCQKQSNFVSIVQKSNGASSTPPAINNKTVDSADVSIGDSTAETEETPTIEKVEVPAKLDLGTPFVSQAPLRIWDEPYNEACEEASMLSAAKYFSGMAAIDNQTANRELLALINWEKENGYKIDVDASEVVEILNQYFNLAARLETEVTVDRIKYELAQNHPIIIPAAGRLLGNPYFRTPGPIYHMLVIRGYDSDEFITNDVGTNTKGEKFRYKYQTIIDSIHNWNHQLAEGGMTDEEMAMGEKVMVVVTSNR